MAEYRFPDHDDVRELDSCSILGWDLPGHDHTMDDVDIFLAAQDIDRRGSDLGPRGAFDVSWCWRTTHPVDEEDLDPGLEEYIYHQCPVPGAVPVVRILESREPMFWCTNHPFEPGMVGRSLNQFTDTNQAWERHWATMDSPDPRPSIDDRLSTGAPYVWFCRDCDRDVERRLDEAREQASVLWGAARAGARAALAGTGPS